MRILGRIIGFILVMLSVPLLASAACNFALAQAALDSATYQDILNDEEIFEDLLPVALPAVLQAVEEEGDVQETVDDSPVRFSEITRTLEAAEWREVANLLVPPEWLQARFSQIVPAILDVLNGDYSTLDEKIDLSEIRSRLTGDEATAAANLVIDSAPVCNRTQLDQIRTLRDNGGGTLPICQPPDENQRRYSKDVMRAWLNSLGQEVSAETLTIGEFLDVEYNDARTLNLLIEVDEQILWLNYLCPLGFLALVVVFTVRSSREFNRWIGTSAIISGFGVLAALFILQMLALSTIANLFDATSEFERFAARVFSGMIRSIIEASSGLMLIQAGLLIIGGFILLALTFINRDDEDKGEVVLIGEDGEIISTASKRSGTLRLNPSD